MSTFRIVDGYATNNFHVSGTLYAQKMVVSSSQILTSGSTIFGDSIDDTHQFTGSVFINDALQVAGNTTLLGDLAISGSFSVADLSTTNIVNSNDLYVLNDAFVSGTLSGSVARIQDNLTVLSDVFISGTLTAVSGGFQNLNVTDDLTIESDSYALGDLYVSGSLTVVGDQHILKGYSENGSFSIPPSATGVDSIAQGQGTTADGDYSVVAGGERNEASDTYSTIGGGFFNTASSPASTVAGGERNVASSEWNTIGGGLGNLCSDIYTTVGGGRINTASNDYSTVCGGYFCVASGKYATVAGGKNNIASGENSAILGSSGSTVSGLGSIGIGTGLNVSTRETIVLGGGEGILNYNIVVSGTLLTTKTVDISDNLNVVGDTSISGTLSASVAKIQDNLTVLGNSFVSGTLFVGSPLTTGSDVSIQISGTVGGKMESSIGVSVFDGDVVASGAMYHYISSSNGVAKYPMRFSPADYVPMASTEDGANEIDVWSSADLSTAIPWVFTRWTASSATEQSGSAVWQKHSPPIPTPSSGVDLEYDFLSINTGSGNAKVLWSVVAAGSGSPETFLHEFSYNEEVWDRKSTTLSTINISANRQVTVRADLFASGSATGSIANVKLIF